MFSSMSTGTSIKKNQVTKVCCKALLLGFYFFFLCANDMTNATLTTPRLLADDICIYMNHSKLSNFQNILSSKLNDLSKLYVDNQLRGR